MSHHIPHRDSVGRFANRWNDIEYAVRMSLCGVLAVLLIGAVVYQYVKPEPLSPVAYFPFLISPVPEFPMREMALQPLTRPVMAAEVTPPVRGSSAAPTKQEVDAYMAKVFGDAYKTAWAVSMVEGYPKTEEPDWGRSYCWHNIGDQGQHRGEYSVGIFQINIVEGCNAEGDKVHWSRIPGDTLEEKIEWLSDPFNNTDFAHQLYTEWNGFGPWTGFTSGNYLEYM